MRGDRFDLLRTAGMMASVGLLLVLATFIGHYLGRLADGWLGTEPWLGLAGLLLGISAGFLQVYKIAKRYMDSW